MRLISLILPIPLQLETLPQILSSTKYLAVSCQNNAFDTIVDTCDSEEMFEFIGHDVCEGIVVVWSI